MPVGPSRKTNSLIDRQSSLETWRWEPKQIWFASCNHITSPLRCPPESRTASSCNKWRPLIELLQRFGCEVGRSVTPLTPKSCLVQQPRTAELRTHCKRVDPEPLLHSPRISLPTARPPPVPKKVPPHRLPLPPQS